MINDTSVANNTHLRKLKCIKYAYEIRVLVRLQQMLKSSGMLSLFPVPESKEVSV
jgi:hypothetical protein